MSPSVDKVSTQRPGVKKPTNTRPMVVPAIPLPLVEKQQQQRQQRQQRQQKQQKRQEELERQKQKELQELQELQKPSNQHKNQIQPALQDQKPVDGSCTPASTPATQLSHPVLSPSQHTNGNRIASPVPVQTPRAPKPGKRRDSGQVALDKPPVQNGSSISRSPAGHSQQKSDSAHRQDINENGTASYRHNSPLVRPDYCIQQSSVQSSLPSNGSMTFGAFHKSEDGSLPPPHDARTGIPPPALIGFHPPVYMPYNPPGPGMVDWPGPPRIALSADLNAYTPTTGFNPSTPGSFRGSQSPDNVNANGISGSSHASNNGPFPLPDLAPLNGTHPALLSPPPPPPPASVYGFPGIGHVKEDIHPREDIHRLSLDFVHFLERQQRQNFHDAQSADCYIFLHFPRGKPELKGDLGNTMERGVSSEGLALANAPPQLFMGHRATLAQSYTISQMLLGSGSATVQTGSFGFPVLVLHISLDDPYISVDASMQALRSMYGYAIDDVSTVAAQSRVQAMDMAISNMAAGFLFMLESVESVGMEQACQLFGWDTIERVLAFCLNGVLLPNAPAVAYDMFGLPYPQAEYSYGRGAGQNIRRLLHKALDFIVWNFPTDFIMQEIKPADASPISLSRFPCISPKQLSADRRHTSDTSSARDGIRDAQQRNPQDNFEIPSSGSVSLPSRTTNPGLKRSPQPSTIMFGDFPPVDGNKALASPPPVVANGMHKPTSVLISEAASTAATLSRVLVGLPFGFVNYILEHPNLSRGCSNRSLSLGLDARRAIARDLVIERESQRQQVVRKLHDDKSVDLDGILARIRNPSPTLAQDYSMDGWDALGWREEWHNEGPSLVRVWTHSRQVE